MQKACFRYRIYAMSKVSVVIPTKNSSSTIRRCLESVKSQSYKSVEIVLVDNHSRDSTVQIAKKYTKKVYLASPERSSQRNFGAKKATGKYLFFVDSDMYLSKNVIKECVENLDENTVGLYIPEKILGNKFWTKVRNFERGFYNSTCIDAVRFLRIKDFFRIKGFDEKLRVGEDWDFDRRLRQFGKTREIFAHVYHDESAFKIWKYIGKKKSYFKDLRLYQTKWKNNLELAKQLGISYRMFGVFIEKNKWKRLVRHPVLSIAMMILRTLVGVEYAIFTLFQNKQK